MHATVAASTKDTSIEVSSRSTRKKRKSSIAARLAEITSSGTKALVESINKIRDSTKSVEDMWSKDMADIADEYFCY